MDLVIISRLTIALTLGLIIGIERGWSNRESPEELGSDGLRNFGLVGLLGGITALLAEEWGWGILGVIFLGFAILVSTSYVLTAQKSQDYGTTTEFALLITFLLGALVVKDLSLESIAVAVIVSWLLKLKSEIRQMLIWLKQEELIATLKVLLLALVTLPLLPNQDLGPWNAINPRAIGLLVLLIVSISYVGYFIIRLWKDKSGVLLIGFLGGFASSTATTIALSRMAKQGQGQTKILATAIALATGTMAPRLLLQIAVINSSLAKQLAIPLIILGLTPILIALIFIWRGIKEKNQEVPITLSNPVELGLAVQYALILIVLSLLIKAGEQWFGETGVYLVSALSGLADVDAVSISLARAVNQNMSLSVAKISIFIAVFMNTLVKIALTRFIGGKELARWCAVIILLTLTFSGITVFVVG
ncbi:MgtC/SapB family protein [Cyanobacterium sp. Dongsha4]|uniref:MgtC/SapB family protein n=1 Tax=Cyanobacterium sp. DS4 TaxID=2878255 RepID=UPI002E81A6E4|nr:MgtC/SapB family protein [Cyanobacterium sp. Dongsha4]WVK99974.1 MgtC/SapB family protein [Cyanobacterium sp. Dongsha4]